MGNFLQGPGIVFENSASAFRALQKAEELLKRPNDEGLEKAIEDYKAAIDADPLYPSAYAKLAIAYSRQYELSRDPGTLELVEANAEKAIRLDRTFCSPPARSGVRENAPADK
jgi:tetratricopeptide (TPR) repeat protein